MIPARTLEAILHWQEHGTHPDQLGSFVRALLTNNLKDAVGFADDENLAALKETVGWVYFNVPGPLWGSRDALLMHHKRRHRESA